MIVKELCKWPYVYTVFDNNKKYVTTIVNNGYNKLCIPIYTSETYIDSKYLNNNYKIRKVKLNKFLKKIDEDKDKHAVAVVLDPTNQNDKVLLSTKELYWYYLPDVSFYW
jgi:hypothetical protein